MRVRDRETFIVVSSLVGSGGPWAEDWIASKASPTHFSSLRMAGHPSRMRCSSVWLFLSKIPTWFSLQLALLPSILFTAAKWYFKKTEIGSCHSLPWLKSRLLHMTYPAQQDPAPAYLSGFFLNRPGSFPLILLKHSSLSGMLFLYSFTYHFHWEPFSDPKKSRSNPLGEKSKLLNRI